MRGGTNTSSLLDGMRRYIEFILDRVPGMKVLLLDAETSAMISLIFTQSQILEKEVFLVERVESLVSGDVVGSSSSFTSTSGSSSGVGGGPSATGSAGGSSSSSSVAVHSVEPNLRHLTAVCLLRPTDKNFMLLSKLIRAPGQYAKFHLFFTNAVQHQRLEQLACCDEMERVREVQEVYCDVYAVTHELWSLNQHSTVYMALRNPVHWTPYEEAIFQRHVEGLLAVILTCLNSDADLHGAVGARVPLIRYPHGSSICQKLANDLTSRMNEEHSLFGRELF